MFDLIKQLFGSGRHEKKTPGSGRQAKDRLRILLVQDRSSVAPDVLSVLRDEIISAISKYVEIDKAAMEISLSHHDESMALVANIPVVRWKRTGQ
jgi:cell division topological specificity factor